LLSDAAVWASFVLLIRGPSAQSGGGFRQNCVETDSDQNEILLTTFIASFKY